MSKSKAMSPENRDAQKKLLEDLMKVVGNNLAECRLAKGYTQSDAAEKLDISIPFLSNMERGKKLMSVPMLLKLAELYGVDANRLLYAEDSDKRDRLGSILLLLQKMPDSDIARMEKHLRIELDAVSQGKDAGE